MHRLSRISPGIGIPKPLYAVGIGLLIWHPAVTASGLPNVIITYWNVLHDVVVFLFILTALPVLARHVQRRSCPIGDVSLLYFVLCIVSTLPLLIVPTLGVPYVRMIVVSLVTFLAVFFLTCRVAQNRPYRTFVWLMIAGGSWAVVSAIRGFERIRSIYGSQTRLDFMGHTNSRAGYEVLIFLLLIGLGIRVSRKYRILLVLLSAILLISLLTSYSRGAWLALCGGIFYIVAVSRGWRSTVITTLALVVFFAILPGALGEKAREGMDPSYPTNVFRIGLWKQVLSYIAANPWGGCGYESLWFSAVAWLNPEEPVLVGRHAHNLYLHTWAELGILGLVGLLWVLWSGLRILGDKELWESTGLSGIRIGFLACFIAIIIHGMVDVTWRDYNQQILFWSMLGWISGVATGDSR